MYVFNDYFKAFKSVISCGLFLSFIAVHLKTLLFTFSNSQLRFLYARHLPSLRTALHVFSDGLLYGFMVYG